MLLDLVQIDQFRFHSHLNKIPLLFLLARLRCYHVRSKGKHTLLSKRLLYVQFLIRCLLRRVLGYWWEKFVLFLGKCAQALHSLSAMQPHLHVRPGE